MKFSESWLREWVDPQISREVLSEQLTMSGLEVDSLAPVAEYFSGVVIGKVLRVQKHPEADQLHICEVGIGRGASLIIVCGAKNVSEGMKAPLALINAMLPNKMAIKESVIRGATSQGMLCSAADLGLSEASEGLLELSSEATEGADFWEYLKLNDYIFDVSITPNRGDCLSLKGMAREVAAITQSTVNKIAMPAVKPTITASLPISIEAKTECPRYVGRILRGVKADVETPVWMQEKLRRSGIRSLSPIVDVTNYVMLELGQPMHAFDLSLLDKQITVRMARPGEELRLLDNKLLTLDTETLVIADQHKPLAIAGVMGGLDSGINLLTKDLFLESAFFTSATVARQRQHYQLNSESAFRFERGVDPELQVQAIERATALLLEIVGGEAGPVIDLNQRPNNPKVLILRREHLNSILGCELISDIEVKDIFKRLGFNCQKEKNHWEIQVPSWRFDVTEEVDLIEEVARLYGYDKITPTRPHFSMDSESIPENRLTLPRVRRLFCDLGYHEVVTYSFVNEEWQALLDPERKPKALVNPITADMSVMRSNLWPGLMGTYLYNRDRQQTRVRFFESGLCFIEEAGHLRQELMLGGLISGTASPEQWAEPSRPLDFYDLKGEVESLLALTRLGQSSFHFKPLAHPALHPGQAATLYRGEQALGVLGALHPALKQRFDIIEPVFLFEFNLDAILASKLHSYSDISRFPEIRRDLALLVDRHIPSEQIQATIVESGGEYLRQVNVFDVYLGEGVPKDKKSVAFALTLQHASRTLRDEEVVETVDRIIRTLQRTWGIELRG